MELRNQVVWITGGSQGIGRASAEAFAEAFLADGRGPGPRPVALNPGGGWIAKRWRAEQFSALGRRINETDGSRILVLWGPGEETLARQVADGIGAGAVCPPRVGSKASGRSRSMIRVTNAGVMGSMYVRSPNSGSVMMVAGLLFTRTPRQPSSRSALQACVPE